MNMPPPPTYRAGCATASMLDLRSETVDEMARSWRSISSSILAWSDCSVELEDFLDFEERCVESRE